MTSKTRTLTLTAATVVAASFAVTRDCFAWQPLDDPFSGSNAGCAGRSSADNKTYIIWTVGNQPFHACSTQREIGDAQGLYDDYDISGNDGNDDIKIGCVITCGSTQIRLEPDLAWGGHYIDLVGGDGNDRLLNEISTGAPLDSWFFGVAGNDWLQSRSPIGRMIAGGGADTLESLSSSATNEWLDGGDGDDCLRASGTNVLYYDCGPGFDKTVSFTLVNQNCDQFVSSCPAPPP